MPQILLINTNCSFNKGSAAQVASVVESLHITMPNASFTLISEFYELDYYASKKYGLKVYGPKFNLAFSKKTYLFDFLSLTKDLLLSIFSTTFHNLGFKINKLVNNDVLKAYQTADLIIDLSGDSLSDHGAVSLFSIFHTLIGIIYKKRVVVFSQSIGPFKKFAEPIVRFCLNRVDLIVVRERESLSLIKKMRLKNPNVFLAAEIAFLLKPEPIKDTNQLPLKETFAIETCHPIIGVGTNELIYRLFKNKDGSYIKIMANICDYLVEKFNVQILLISHMIIPDKCNVDDDRLVALEIYQMAKNKNRIRVLQNDYSTEELKRIIGACTLFIGTRMHSNIAALSMHVPTIAIGWSHKYYGIMEMLNMEKYCCDARTTSYEEIIEVLTDAWCNRNEIRHQLVINIPTLEKSAYRSILLVKSLIDSK